MENSNGMGVVFGPNGNTNLTFNAGGLTFANGAAYSKIGDNFAVGTDGKTYLKLGNAIVSNDGSTHLTFGDNPKFIV